MQLGKFTSTNLKDFYEEINSFQCEAHGEDYNEMHRPIKEYLEEGDSYKEFGVMQGGTASCAMLQNPASVELVDINFTRFDPYSYILKEYARENNIVLKKHKCSSDSLQCASLVDFLLIDSRHDAGHMKRELAAHGMNVRKHIVCHDTYKLPELQNVLVEWVQSNPEWKVIEYYQSNVGFTHISKVL